MVGLRSTSITSLSLPRLAHLARLSGRPCCPYSIPAWPACPVSATVVRRRVPPGCGLHWWACTPHGCRGRADPLQRRKPLRGLLGPMAIIVVIWWDVKISSHRSVSYPAYVIPYDKPGPRQLSPNGASPQSVWRGTLHIWTTLLRSGLCTVPVLVAISGCIDCLEA